MNILPSFRARRYMRDADAPTAPDTLRFDVILRDGAGQILTLVVDIDAATPAHQLLRTCAIAALCQRNISSGRIEAITLRTRTNPPSRQHRDAIRLSGDAPPHGGRLLSAFDLLLGDE